ncbi:hypothetical protein SESBI_45071 [Sesbania bispinosa]|nr:hypothetical protein SESBI_45071 [Sesbania bispinosa]
MGHELVGVVFEAEEVVAVLVDGGGELVLDAFPGSEVSGFFVVVLPDIASRLEDDAWSGRADLSGVGETALEERGFLVEGFGTISGREKEVWSVVGRNGSSSSLLLEFIGSEVGTMNG